MTEVNSCAVCFDDCVGPITPFPGEPIQLNRLELADKTARITLPCKHEFHTDCIKTWFAQMDVPSDTYHQPCPVCKQNFTILNVRPTPWHDLSLTEGIGLGLATLAGQSIITFTLRPFPFRQILGGGVGLSAACFVGSLSQKENNGSWRILWQNVVLSALLLRAGLMFIPSLWGAHKAASVNTGHPLCLLQGLTLAGTGGLALVATNRIWKACRPDDKGLLERRIWTGSATVAAFSLCYFGTAILWRKLFYGAEVVKNTSDLSKKCQFFATWNGTWGAILTATPLSLCWAVRRAHLEELDLYAPLAD